MTQQQVAPWKALWAMLLGFFMILVDSTIVAVANPSIMAALDISSYDAIIWVTSAYLLAYAVPLLLSGRLGDRYGPKNLYIAGLLVFTVASLWCGLSGSIQMLIAARVLGHRRRVADAADVVDDHPDLPAGTTRGGAEHVGGDGRGGHPGRAAGGRCAGRSPRLVVDLLRQRADRDRRGGAGGPAGSVLETHRTASTSRAWCCPESGCSSSSSDCRRGQTHDWARWIWGTIVVGVVFMAMFVWWQAHNHEEPR